jgi:hypothetical protein
MEMPANRRALEWRAPCIRLEQPADRLAASREAGVNVTLVSRMEDIPHDEQLQIKNVLVPPVGPDVPMPLVINHPLNIDGLPVAGVKHAPGLGEHTAEILAEPGRDGARSRITGAAASSNRTQPPRSRHTAARCASRQYARVQLLHEYCADRRDAFERRNAHGHQQHHSPSRHPGLP